MLLDAGRPMPDTLQELIDWSPFAVIYRYEEWSGDAPLDRTNAVSLVEDLLDWANTLVGQPETTG